MHQPRLLEIDQAPDGVPSDDAGHVPADLTESLAHNGVAAVPVYQGDD